MIRSLALKGLMLLLTAAAVAGILRQEAPSHSGSDGGPSSPEPIIVQTTPPAEPISLGVTAATPQAVSVPPIEAIRPTKRAVRQAGSRPSHDTASATGAVSAKLDVNHATQQDFERLPGIGPGLAKQLVDHRATHGAYSRIEDLQAVKGIGAKRYARLAPFVMVSPPSLDAPRRSVAPRKESRVS